MKKYYIVFLLIAVSLVSCDDFLDTKDYTNKNDQNFPLTEKDANMSLASCYHVRLPVRNFLLIILEIFFLMTVLEGVDRMILTTGMGPDEKVNGKYATTNLDTALSGSFSYK